ncbi:hypothetical protein [Gemmatimonas sp.]|uniref:hypothetical protein n=1 Tax=Gemmatimonas sp. TaxID=1962908 RepID=UPI00398342A8
MNRRALFTDDHDLATLVRQATDVVPSGALLDRVHASRADGMRVMLPNGDAATVPIAPAARSSSIDALTVEQLAGRVWMIGLAVAASLVAAVMALWPRQAANGSLQATASAMVDSALLDSLTRTTATASPRESLAEQLSPWPRVTFAQSPGAAARNAPYPGLFALDEGRLKPGRRSYLRSVGNTMHELLPYTTYSVELAPVELEKQGAWRLVTVTQTSTGLAENSERNAEHDTVWLRRNDLRPIRRARHAGFLRMRQTFTDSMLIETDSLIAPRGMTRQNGRRLMPFRGGGSKHLDAAVPFVPTEESMRLLLRATRLHANWKRTVGVLSGDDRAFAMGEPDYLNLRVAGSRDVQTLSGRYATWRVILETGAKPEVWYVSKETGETLLTEGPWGVSFLVSETRLLYGFEETKRVPTEPSRR